MAQSVNWLSLFSQEGLFIKDLCNLRRGLRQARGTKKARRSGLSFELAPWLRASAD
jgi:hypothetical protein